MPLADDLFDEHLAEIASEQANETRVREVRDGMASKKFKNLRDEIRANPRRAARVEEYKRAIYDALALAELRQGRDVTQTDLAKVLGVSQTNVSRIEHESDLYVSTLRAYVEALGGELELRAVFPERTAAIALHEAELAH